MHACKLRITFFSKATYQGSMSIAYQVYTMALYQLTNHLTLVMIAKCYDANSI